MQQAEHFFWFGGPNARPSYLDEINPVEANRLYDFTTHLTLNNRRHLRHIHLLDDLSPYLVVRSPWFRPPPFSGLLGNNGVCPEILTVAFRYAGGEGRPQGQRMRLEDHWLHQLLCGPAVPRLRKIRIELEAAENRIEDLRPIISQLQREWADVQQCSPWPNPLARAVLQSPLVKWTWSSEAKGDRGSNEYHVVRLEWDKISGDEIPRAFPPRDNLDVPEPNEASDDATTAAIERWERKWQGEGSLLKLVQIKPEWRYWEAVA